MSPRLVFRSLPQALRAPAARWQNKNQECTSNCLLSKIRTRCQPAAFKSGRRVACLRAGSCLDLTLGSLATARVARGRSSSLATRPSDPGSRSTTCAKQLHCHKLSQGERNTDPNERVDVESFRLDLRQRFVPRVPAAWIMSAQKVSCFTASFPSLPMIHPTRRHQARSRRETRRFSRVRERVLGKKSFRRSPTALQLCAHTNVDQHGEGET